MQITIKQRSLSVLSVYKHLNIKFCLDIKSEENKKRQAYIFFIANQYIQELLQLTTFTKTFTLRQQKRAETK